MYFKSHNPANSQQRTIKDRNNFHTRSCKHRKSPTGKPKTQDTAQRSEPLIIPLKAEDVSAYPQKGSPS